MDDIAIQVSHVDKLYKLYDKPSDRLKESLRLTKQKKYREHFALHNMDFQIHKGETVGIIGTNGSGKSTILKIITGVLNPSAGMVQVHGRISALLELGAGFNQEYTGLENVYLNGTMIGFEKAEIDARLDDILSFADIGEFIHQPVKTYSSGMFVRLAFAVAINIDPEILIVDEALSVGDVFFQGKCYRKFEEFKKLGKTILFVSHDLGSINKYCDRVILLNNGIKLAEGNTKEIIDMYKKLLVNQLDMDNDLEIKNVEMQEQDIFDKENSPKKMETTNWKDAISINPNLLEYGNKIAEIIDFAIVDESNVVSNTVEKGVMFAIKMKVQFKEAVDEPIFAFTIKDIRGTDITGTNTLLEKMDINSIKAGEIRIITFAQKMVLQGGEYMLSLGITGYCDGKFEVFHRLYDICTISVISSQNTIGFFDIDSKIQIT